MIQETLDKIYSERRAKFFETAQIGQKFVYCAPCSVRDGKIVPGPGGNLNYVVTYLGRVNNTAISEVITENRDVDAACLYNLPV